MSFERQKLDWFRVRSEADLERLSKWAAGKRSTCNTYNGPKTDKRGDWIMLLGYDRRPDSDWGRFQGHSAAVWYGSEELARKGEDAIRKAWGFEALDRSEVAA